MIFNANGAREVRPDPIAARLDFVNVSRRNGPPRRVSREH
ncbi:hypothetical protein FHR21_003553 [Sphingopyxis panaciterrulae]|uniref:Uncharacterized protein n=1 Tax=Sphingopyxis panaciterrulae TaxID=462372 RepID=A0A7W9B8F2_9SPHN|nr:hypothetical protein [Sphingopyxis panaciterrulae]